MKMILAAFMLSTIASSVAFSQVVEVPVSGMKMSINNDFSTAVEVKRETNASIGETVHFKTTNFTWATGCQTIDAAPGSLCSVSPGLVHQGGNRFLSRNIVGPKGGDQGTGGWLERTFEFSIKGREPSKTYNFLIAQKFDAKSRSVSDWWDLDQEQDWSYASMIVRCGHKGTPEHKILSQKTEDMASTHGRWYNNQTFYSNLTINPGQCPSNYFQIFFSAIRVDELKIGDLDLTILEQEI